jgi:hypothetical protein
MVEWKWGRIMYAHQIGIMVSWGHSVIPNKKYICIELPFFMIQIFI